MMLLGLRIHRPYILLVGDNMPIEIGTNLITNTKLYIGTTKVDKVYVGDTIIFPYVESQLNTGNFIGQYALSMMML